MTINLPFAAALFCSVLAARADGLPNADGDFTIGPLYTNAPELSPRDGVPKGALHEFTMDSSASKSYPGLTGPYQRKVYVYVPSQYVPGTPAPFIVVQDGRGYTNRLPVVLDNMIHDHRLPVMLAVLIHHGGGDGKGSERGLEYDTVSDKYTDVRRVRGPAQNCPRLPPRLHHRPRRPRHHGRQFRRRRAFTMAWFHPELYRKVLSYSGTFVAQESPDNPKSPHGAWEYHEHFIPQGEAKPLRVWLQVGENDIGSKRDEASYHNWVMANRRMAAALKAKGYHYQFVYCLAAGHVDRKAVAQTLPDALAWLWQGYPVK